MITEREIKFRLAEGGDAGAVRAAIERAFAAGASDYIPKPFQVDEVRARVGQALEKRRLILENREYHQHLAEMVDQQALRIEELFLEGVQTLAHALEAKDRYRPGHSARVAAVPWSSENR